MRSIEYPKTDNLLMRDVETRKLIPGEYKRPDFQQIKSWVVTEKIDGTNMRLLYAPETGEFEVRGRSDRANIPGDLRQRMLALCEEKTWAATFRDFLAPHGDPNRSGHERTEWGTVTVFGEGYGPGIQQGGYYGPIKDFAMFDVMYHWPDGHDSWCQPSTTKWLSGELGIPHAPVLSNRCTTEAVFDIVAGWLMSIVALENGTVHPAEGVIARTDPYLYNERGQRVMFKLKGDDLVIPAL